MLHDPERRFMHVVLWMWLLCERKCWSIGEVAGRASRATERCHITCKRERLQARARRVLSFLHSSWCRLQTCHWWTSVTSPETRLNSWCYTTWVQGRNHAHYTPFTHSLLSHTPFTQGTAEKAAQDTKLDGKEGDGDARISAMS
jgi:hypothetical protein